MISVAEQCELFQDQPVSVDFVESETSREGNQVYRLDEFYYRVVVLFSAEWCWWGWYPKNKSVPRCALNTRLDAVEDVWPLGLAHFVTSSELVWNYCLFLSSPLLPTSQWSGSCHYRGERVGNCQWIFDVKWGQYEEEYKNNLIISYQRGDGHRHLGQGREKRRNRSIRIVPGKNAASRKFPTNKYLDGGEAVGCGGPKWAVWCWWMKTSSDHDDQRTVPDQQFLLSAQQQTSPGVLSNHFPRNEQIIPR